MNAYSALTQFRQHFAFFRHSQDTAGQPTPICYLDSAATTQKPDAVLQALMQFYQFGNANVHRAGYQLAAQATAEFERARDTVARFIQAPSAQQVIWTKGCTEAINLVAHGLAEHIQPGDTIVVTELEHHANFVPWQQLAKAKQARLAVVSVNAQGVLNHQQFTQLLQHQPKIVAFNHVANATGNVQPLADWCLQANAAGAIVVVDGAQGISHERINVSELALDFYAFSGHKLFAPTGIGVLYMAKRWLTELPVYQTGGEMVASVGIDDTTFNVAPFKFEAGTPAIAQAIGLGAAIEFLLSQDWHELQQQKKALYLQLLAGLQQLPGLELYGDLTNNAGIAAFNIAGLHPQDVAMVLNEHNVAVRAGAHCTHPWHAHLPFNASLRASLSFYNTAEDVDQLLAALTDAIALLSDN